MHGIMEMRGKTKEVTELTVNQNTQLSNTTSSNWTLPPTPKRDGNVL